ncbi:MAG: hypothetical protein HYT13_00930 [Candidatus Liptonbacteria bacterium]|nr:hypothetical protein [Candidatus Liptonbacteria bacterium]
MNLLELLKKLKGVEPDKHYTEKSRLIILSTPLAKKLKYTSPWLPQLKFIGAFAIASLIFFILLGGFSNSKFSAPLKLSNLDPVGLKAEADAIDIQIQLTDIHYQESSGAENESTQALPLNNVQKQAENLSLKNQTPSTSTPEITIDEALDRLSR